jgi:DNA-binding MarR family transcriptional regulator
MSRRSDDELARAWHELIGQYHRTTCVLDRELEAAHGIGSSDFEVLQVLCESGPQCSMRMADLGQRVHLSQSALSRLVARLEKRGLLERTMCANDRRSVFTTITAAGRKLYQEARVTQRGVLREAATAAST